MPLRLAITPGEPAGIGPDIMVQLAQNPSPYELVAVADPDLLQQRASVLKLPLSLETYDPEADVRAGEPGSIRCLPVKLATAAIPGTLNVRNADYVLETLNRATDGCLAGRFDALVTGPIHKGIINDAGIAFTGHTEFLASRCGEDVHPVMMLATAQLRVALVTTHLPLRKVSDAITAERLERVCRILHQDLIQRFNIAEPRILVCGLNPHAGEDGHLGMEEIEIISPVLERLRAEGFNLVGPLPADTLFTPRLLQDADAVLAMYHDQGLPVLKYSGFGEAVNVTLGLPIIRTSVDHGTALSLAGSGQADIGSLLAAINMAATMAENKPEKPVSI